MIKKFKLKAPAATPAPVPPQDKHVTLPNGRSGPASLLPSQKKPTAAEQAKKAEAILRRMSGKPANAVQEIADDEGRPRNTRGPFSFKEVGLTQSMIGQFQGCPKKWMLGAVCGYSVRQTSMALNFGNLFHEALDRIYTAVRDKIINVDVDSLNAFAEALIPIIEKQYMDSQDAMSAEEMQQTEEGLSMLQAVLPEYIRQWVSDFEDETKMNWVALEEEFEIVDPITDTKLRGKFDGIFRDQDGKLWLFETKTKGQWDEEALSTMIERDLQVNVYLMAMEQKYGEKPAGVLYNIIRRPLLRRKKEETLRLFYERCAEDVINRPEHYFSRLRVTVDPKTLQDSRTRIRAQIKTMQWTLQNFSIFDIPEHTGECIGKFGKCPFLAHCATGSMDGIEVHHRFGNLFPELPGARKSIETQFGKEK